MIYRSEAPVTGTCLQQLTESPIILQQTIIINYHFTNFDEQSVLKHFFVYFDEYIEGEEVENQL